MQALTTACLIVGTSLLGIEALGRKRALRIESAIRKGALGAERAFGAIVALMIAPWKKHEEITALAQADHVTRGSRGSRFLHEGLPRWVYPAFLTLSFLSLFLFRYVANRFGEALVTVLCLSSWLGMILTSVSTVLLISAFQKTLRGTITRSAKAKLILLSATIEISGIQFAVTALVTFLSCLPAGIIFLGYVAIYLASTGVRRIIDLRQRYKLGNILVLLGFVLSTTGIILQHLISVKAIK